MKSLMLICGSLLFLGLFSLPIGYYTFLRIIVFVTAGLYLIQHYNGELKPWIIVFGILMIIFNPVFPVYLGEKSRWLLIDIIAGALFLAKAFNLDEPSTKNQ